MNATYEQLSTIDVARMLRVDRTSITKWCKSGLINYTDVSGPGSAYPRYIFDEDEVEYIKQLRQKYGRNHWMTHYTKDWKVQTKTAEEPQPWVLDTNSVVADKELYPTVPVESTHNPDFDEDKLLNSILHIREIKEEMENCKARLAQLENEYRECKGNIMEWL